MNEKNNRFLKLKIFVPKQREILFFDSLNLKLFFYLKVNGFEILETGKS